MSITQQYPLAHPYPGKDYYDQNYRHYRLQNPDRKFNYYRRLINQYFNPALPRSIHDIGCAFGLFL